MGERLPCGVGDSIKCRFLSSSSFMKILSVLIWFLLETKSCPKFHLNRCCCRRLGECLGMEEDKMGWKNGLEETAVQMQLVRK